MRYEKEGVFFRLAALAMALTAIPVPIRAQVTTATLYGVVIDSTGPPFPEP